jgi:short-subunit dehydrogenase
MVERGRGTILLTGATAAVKGLAKFAALAVGKFGLRALAQSLAREFSPQGIHVAHIIIDGMINTQRVRSMVSEAEEHTLLAPEAIAQTYWQLYQQDATAWTLELDLRPAVEKSYALWAGCAIRSGYKAHQKKRFVSRRAAQDTRRPCFNPTFLSVGSLHPFELNRVIKLAMTIAKF